jgi:hypothetical protein
MKKDSRRRKLVACQFLYIFYSLYLSITWDPSPISFILFASFPLFCTLYSFRQAAASQSNHVVVALPAVPCLLKG